MLALPHRTALYLLLATPAWFVASGAAAQIEFEDVSAAAGMTGFTESWGATWGDLNGDNWPDPLHQGHRDYPRIYRNTGTGTFEDIAYELDPGEWIADPFDDKHGASFADYDNDGDDDIMITVSTTGDAQFLVNEAGTFTNRADEADLKNDLGARLAAWFDYTGDGNLDITQLHTTGAFLRFRDPTDSVEPAFDFDDDITAGFDCAGRVNYAQFIDIDNDGTQEFLCVQEGAFPLRAWDVSTTPFTDVTASFPVVGNVNDSVIADFNNDLLSDIVLISGALRPSGAALVNDFRLEAWLRKGATTPPPPRKGFYFESNGEITVTIDYRGLGVFDDPVVATLSPTGTTEVVAGPVKVEWLPAETRWKAYLRFSTADQAYLQIDAVTAITNVIEDQFDIPELATVTEHLVNSPTGLTRDFSTGLFVPKYCVSGVAADFDNDMDQDLYLVCRRGPENLANRLFENQGNGTFIERTAFGGEGPLGTGFAVGVGESVAIADYDVDGFVDLFVTNGLLFYPIGVGGPDTLLRNKGNSNHWLELDLDGTLSNRDGVGAKVLVTAGGVTQLREQNGGYHRWSQNHQRLHFGLAGNTTADITIEWPSGTTDTFTAVAGDTLYTATEGGSLTPATLGPPVFTELNPGDECGVPPYNLNYGPAVLLWKDCTSGIWSLRAQGGRETQQLLFTAGQIVGDGPFSSVSPASLNAGDTLTNTAPQLIEFSVGAWFSNNKGFDFSTAGQASACLSFDAQDIPTLIVGSSRKKITGGIDLVTLLPCAAPPAATGLQCGEPDFDNNTENGLFAWRECGYPLTNVARWNFALSGGGAPFNIYPGLIDSDTVLAATGSDLEANDVLDTVPGDAQIDFELRLGGNGVDRFQVDVPASSTSCLQTDTFPSGTPVVIGENKLPRTDNFDLLTLETCEVSCHP